MYKLLIADDELYVREYMKTVLDWESMGISLCGCARGSLEALEIAGREKPDMALLDINMPDMDGLELTERLKSNFPELVLAFVTGYSEFEYARKALQLGADEYILKPFSTEELENAIRRMMLKLQKRSQERMRTREDRKVLRENLLRQIFASKEIAKLADIQERMKRVGLLFPYECFLAAQIELHFTEDMQEADIALWKFSIRNIIEEYPAGEGAVLYTLDGEEKKVSLLLNGKKEYLNGTGMGKYFSNVQKMIWEYLGFLVTIGVGKPKEAIGDIRDSFRESESACQEQQTKGAGRLYFYKEVEAERQKPRSRRAEEIIRAVETVIRENYQDSGLTVDTIAERVYLDASYIRRIFSRYRGCTVVDCLTEFRMQEAKRLLLEGGMTVAQIAEQVGYLDPGYFTKCFKKYFGVTPSNYPVFS